MLSSMIEDYLKSIEDVFKWEKVYHKKYDSFDYFVLDVTSLRWQETIWRHYVVLLVPHKIDYSDIYFTIRGGNNSSPYWEAPSTELIAFVKNLGIIVTAIYNVPNQPYSSDNLSEDALVAWSWKQFLASESPDITHAIHWSMVKASLMGMKAIEEFLSLSSPLYWINGRSKRGWTAYLLAIAHPRVRGLIPMVIDFLNIHRQLTHHNETYNGWANSFNDYVNLGLMDDEIRNNKPFLNLIDLCDPYQYLERYRSLAKYLIHSAGDEFFPPDSSQFYWNDLPGQKSLRYLPNCDHSINDATLLPSVMIWIKTLLKNQELPFITMINKTENKAENESKNKNNYLVSASTTPSSVHLCWATNRESRDFRLETIGNEWQKKEIAPINKDLTYRLALDNELLEKLKNRRFAYFLEFLFIIDNDLEKPFIITTEIIIS